MGCRGDITLQGQHIEKTNLVIHETGAKEEKDALMLLMNPKFGLPCLRDTMKICADVKRIVVSNDTQDDFVHNVLNALDSSWTRG